MTKATNEIVWLPLSDTCEVHDGTTGASCPAARWMSELAVLVRAVDLGCSLDFFAPPCPPLDLAWHRWVVGHQTVSLEWRFLRAALMRTAPLATDEIVALLDLYSVFLLYTGSCPAQIYTQSIRPQMAECHPAFSGEWARDYHGIPRMLKQAAHTHPSLIPAIRRNHHVHSAVAARLVPSGGSLLSEAGRRARSEPSPAELDLYDRFFATRRTPLCEHGLRAQLLDRLLKIITDVETSGLYYGSSPLSTVTGEEHKDSVLLIERQVSGLLLEQARDLAATTKGVDVLEARHAHPAIPPLGPLLGGPMKLRKDVELTEALREYMIEHGSPPDSVARELIERTSQLGGIAEMQIPPEQGALLTLLAQLIEARLVVEVGTFTGYSTLCLARGLSPGGKVVTCDLSKEWTDIGRQMWKRAGVDDSIELWLGPASETLTSLPEEPIVDMTFIDADKKGYIGYWELLVPRVRPGGLILVDNVFYSGAVVDAYATGNAATIRAFNDHVQADTRVEVVMLPIADGLTLARKVRNTAEGRAS